MRRPSEALSPIESRWRQLSIVQRGTVAILIPILCLGASLSALLWLRHKGIEIEKAVDHSQIVLFESNALLLAMLNAETGVRGYYAARQPEFLEPYEQAVAMLPPILERLEKLVRDDPSQAERIKTLKFLTGQKSNILRAGIQETKRLTLKNNIQTNSLALTLFQGKVVMDNFRRVLAELETEERQVLKQRQQQLQYQRDISILIILLGILISSLGSLIAISLFRSLAKELQQGELLLQESRNLIRAIFANVVDGVVILNTQNFIEEANRAAEQLFGYTRPELLGQSWTLLIVGPEADVNRNLSGSVPETSLAPSLWQTTGQQKNGTWFPIEVSVSAIELDSRRIMIIRDVSERQQAAAKLQGRANELAALNAELRVTNETLSERNRDLDQFAYAVSHDLKAPLRAIANLSSWIEEDLGDQLPMESRQHMQLLHGRVHRLESLLNGLLDYARIGRTEIAIETVNVSQLLTNVIRMIAPPTTFQFEISPAMPIFKARTLLLQQVFMNLISNAVEHHPTETGKVTIAVQDQGDFYEFAIADDGKGIDPRFHEKIYTIFQTLQARDTHESRGIGLTMVKKIVEMEGGSIQLESTMGAGATFRFTWPKQPLRTK